jgi:hypothetical protein
MEEISHKYVGRLLESFASVFTPNAEFTKDTLEVYYVSLKDFSKTQVSCAVREWIKTKHRFPYPADLINLIHREADKARF